MNDRHDHEQNIVDRAVGALRQTHVPAAAPPEGLAAKLAEAEALEAAKSPKSIMGRILTMKHKSKIAAMATATAAIVTVIIMFTIGNSAATIAWADVQEQIRNARTMTFKATTKVEGFPNMEMKQMFKEPGLIRMEMTMGPSKSITIMDIQQSKIITLVEAQKTAMVFDLTGLPAEIQKKYKGQDFLAEIKKLVEESETELGEKEIDGRAVKGYRVEKVNQVITIWADARTGQPVEMNMTMFQGESEITMSDFKFDVELDESLFSLDIPEGYTVEKQQMEIKEASIEDVVEMLRMWVKVRGGTFPDVLTPGHFMNEIKRLPNGGKDGKSGVQVFGQKPTKDDGLKLTLNIGRAMLLLAQHSEAQYAGKEVKLGDAKTPIFWYKPKDSETYKVIYGDLRIEDVAEENLPKLPQEAKVSE